MPCASLASRCLLAVTLLSLVAACGSGSTSPTPVASPTPPPTTMDVEASATSLRLTVGSQTVTVTNTGTVTGGPIRITRATVPTLSATFLRADGTQDPVSHGGNFQLGAATGNGSILTFTRTSAFGGTLTGVAMGSTYLYVSLYHTTAGDNDFGPFPVPVTVN